MAGGAAYRRLQKPNDGLSQSAQYWGGQAARRNNMFLRSKLADDRQKAAENRAAQRKFDEDFASSLSGIKAFDTKNNDLNTLVIRGVERAKEKMYDYAKIADPANTSTSREEKIQAMAEMKKLEAIPEKLKIMSSQITQQIEANQAGLSDGTLRATPEAEDFMKSGYDLGDDNNVVSDVLIKDGEVYYGYKNQESGNIKTISFKEISSGQMPSYLPTWSREDALERGNKLMGTFTNTNQEGFTTTEDVTLNAQSQQLSQALANKTFSVSENGKNSIPLQNMLLDMGLDPNTTVDEQDLQEIRSQFSQDLGANLGLSHSRTIDQNAMTSRMRRNDAKKKEMDQYSTPEIAVDQQTGQPVRRTIETQSASDLPANQEGYLVTFDGGNSLTLEENENERTEVENVTVTDQGKVFADVQSFRRVFDEATSSYQWKEVKNRKGGELGMEELSAKSANNLFRNSTLRKEDGERFKNAKEFVDYTKSKYEKQGGTRKPLTAEEIRKTYGTE